MSSPTEAPKAESWRLSGCPNLAAYKVKTAYGTYPMCRSCVRTRHMALNNDFSILEKVSVGKCACEHFCHTPEGRTRWEQYGREDGEIKE